MFNIYKNIAKIHLQYKTNVNLIFCSMSKISLHIKGNIFVNCQKYDQNILII